MGNMEKQNLNPESELEIEAFRSFLSSPPDGTPRELLDFFSAMGEHNLLPPSLFLETVEQAPVAISITDPEASILYVNSAFEQLTGYARDEIIGANESILSSNSTPSSVYQELWQTIKDNRVWKGKLVNHRKDKREYLAELTISPVLRADGEANYFLGMHRDITAMHQLEQRLKFQQTLTEAAINAAPMVVAMISAKRKVVLDNMAYKALQGDFRGVEPAELFLDSLHQEIGFDLGSPEKKQKEFENIEVCIESLSSTSPRWFACSGAWVAKVDEEAQSFFKAPNNDSGFLLFIANEITAQRQRVNEARLNMIRANMTEQQMVQTMREAISASIYKLQVPLNVIKAALAMPAPEHQCSLHATLQQALESGDDAMESLHAALPSPTLEQTANININEILHEVIKLSTDKLLASGVIVDWRPAPVLPCLNGRANALRGLFKYLIDNAIQAVKESELSDKEIRLDTRVINQELIIEVMDNGIGLPNSMRIKVFEPFFCGWQQAGEHSGMGLTMAQEVVINHGGSMEFDGGFLGGCRVFIRLPINDTGGEYADESTQ